MPRKLYKKVEISVNSIENYYLLLQVITLVTQAPLVKYILAMNLHQTIKSYFTVSTYLNTVWCMDRKLKRMKSSRHLLFNTFALKFSSKTHV